MFKKIFKGCNLIGIITALTQAPLDPEKQYVIEVKPYHKKRSMSQNAYSWVLTDKLSDVIVLAGIKLSKEETHAEMIYQFGQVSKDKNDNSVVFSTKQNIDFHEFYPYAMKIGTGTVGGEEFTHWKIYRESHTYDTREMAIFLKGIVLTCEQYGIPTATPREIEQMEGNK